MIGFWLLLAASPVLDNDRLIALETESQRRLTQLAPGCRRMEVRVVQRGQIGALRHARTTFVAQAELRSGTWRYLSWDRQERRGDMSGYNDWPFVQPGAGRHSGGSDAVVRFLGSLQVPTVESFADDSESGAVLEQRIRLQGPQGRALLRLTTAFDAQDRARSWEGEVDGVLPYEDSPLDGLHWTFLVSEQGLPLHEAFRTRVRLSTTTVRVHSSTDFVDLGPC